MTTSLTPGVPLIRRLTIERFRGISALTCLRAAEATAELSQVRFRSGVGISLEVLGAENTLTEARTTLVAAIIGYDASQVRLLRSLGAVSPAALLAEPNHAREGE